MAEGIMALFSFLSPGPRAEQSLEYSAVQGWKSVCKKGWGCALRKEEIGAKYSAHVSSPLCSLPSNS